MRASILVLILTLRNTLLGDGEVGGSDGLDKLESR